MTRDRMNLKGVRTLLVDADAFGVNLMTQMLHGLGLDTLETASSGGEAQKRIEADTPALCLCDADLPDMPAPALVQWIRRLPTQARFLPLLVLTGYSDFRNVTAFRDAGAHLVMKKPASPQALYDRIAWVARPPRAFVECDSYAGPDRRFKSVGPPGGVPRRATDLSREIGAATEPNLSQDEIDSLIRPMRIAT